MVRSKFVFVTTMVVAGLFGLGIIFIGVPLPVGLPIAAAGGYGIGMLGAWIDNM